MYVHLRTELEVNRSANDTRYRTAIDPVADVRTISVITRCVAASIVVQAFVDVGALACRRYQLVAARARALETARLVGTHLVMRRTNYLNPSLHQKTRISADHCTK